MQDTIMILTSLTGFFFTTYPLNEEEYMKYVHGRATFAEHFFETAAKHLRPGGGFYFISQMKSIRSAAVINGLFLSISRLYR
jgi:guanidinoacetate N-methyltransferase